MGEIIPDKMSRTLLYLREINIRIHVRLYDDKNNFHNEFTYGNKKYLKLDPPGVYVTLEMAKLENGTYSPDRALLISQMNIGAVVKTMKTVLGYIYNEKIFSIRDNEITIYSDMAEKFTEKLILPRTNQVLVIKPNVVYDENEVSYEGVRLYLNKLSNAIDLSIDEFEAVIDTLSKVDLFQYSQLMLNYIAIKYPDGVTDTETRIARRYNKVNWDKPAKEGVESNFRKSVDDNKIFEGFNSDGI